MQLTRLVTRRGVLTAALVVPVGWAVAQGGSPFIGEWAGQVEGIGDARIVITGVGANGRVMGRMEFTLNSFSSTFSDKDSPGLPASNVGTIEGSVLSIESALGGRYELTLAGSRLSGSYVRGTTLRTRAEFTRQ